MGAGVGERPLVVRARCCLRSLGPATLGPGLLGPTPLGVSGRPPGLALQPSWSENRRAKACNGG